jgi:hypothetical protein
MSLRGPTRRSDCTAVLRTGPRRGRRSNLNATNWLRLALFSRAPNTQGLLITHCQQLAYCQPAPTGIGFVLHGCPCLSFPAGISRSAIVGPRPPNWVRFARFTPGRATAHTITTFAHIPHSPQVWLRFAQFPPSTASGRAKLGSFRTFDSAAGPRPTRQLLSPHTPVHPSLASFCTISSVRRPGRAKLGSFRTFHSQATPRTTAGAAPHTPAAPSLASFCMISLCWPLPGGAELGSFRTI